ncbi:hypothetical protein BKA58DRAFT_440613 [Alternaria rosae]|uniref:uncharacterized protein n=1 Tax=Alternaria rosae TaxID=1187941 RepID=UPI001E8D2E18|nr:uncharacterized protein BKA58DRAFT_440613 [Alternaria rosae]KAH6868158.1 hypothetical protein BKA58DRAFT_440613 [Alternaria rosae]
MDADMTSPAPAANPGTTFLFQFTSKSRCDDKHTYATSIQNEPKAQATAFARTMYSQPPDRTLAIWINSTIRADLRNQPCAIVVGYNSRTTSVWTGQATIAHYTNAKEATLSSIGEALRVAASPTITEQIDRVLIFSNAQSVLKSMKMGHSFGLIRDRWLVDDIPHLNKQLAEKKVEVEFHWFPALPRIESQQRVRRCSQRFKKLALAEHLPELLDRAVSFPAVRLDSMLATESVREDFVRGWFPAAFKDVRVVPRRELSRDLRVQARQAIDQRRRERKEKMKARRVMDAAEREIRQIEKETRRLLREKGMKAEEQEVLDLADDSVATTDENLDKFEEQERQCILVEDFESMELV